MNNVSVNGRADKFLSVSKWFCIRIQLASKMSEKLSRDIDFTGVCPQSRKLSRQCGVFSSYLNYFGILCIFHLGKI